MGECTCWSVGAWVWLVLACVSTGLFAASALRLAATRRRLERVARERDAAREAMLDATVRREFAEAERFDPPDPYANGPLDVRLLAESEVRRAARYGRALSMILLRWPRDVLPGDPLWTRLFDVLRGQLRASDTAGRLDVSSALILLPEAELPVAQAVAARVVAEFASDPALAGDGVRFAAGSLTPADASADSILGRLTKTLEEAQPG
jgi:hypothetical protein